MDRCLTWLTPLWSFGIFLVRQKRSLIFNLQIKNLYFARAPCRQQRARPRPDLNDFVAGWRLLLKPAGLLTMEFPHLLQLIEEVQFDTIYHEHFSYFSLLAVERVFRPHGRRSSTSSGSRPTAVASGSSPAERMESIARRRRRSRPSDEKRRRPGSIGWRAMPDLPNGSRRSKPALSDFLESVEGRGRHRRRLRGGGQGQHAAEHLRDRRRPDRLRGRPESAQAGPLPAGQPTCRSTPPSGFSRPDPTTC